VGDRDNIRTTREEDRALEAVLLKHVLALHPDPLTLGDLIRELGGGEESFELRDAVERAVRDLCACGLLHRGEALILPSRAALRCEQLIGGSLQ
jgi:hypothetical protein